MSKSSFSPTLVRARVRVLGVDHPCGVQLLRLLRAHPAIELVQSPDDVREGAGRGEVCVVCLPPGEAARVVPELLKAGARVLEVSGRVPGDVRGEDPAPALGLPELVPVAELQEARHVMVPRGATTALTLALAPLARSGDLTGRVAAEISVGHDGADPDLLLRTTSVLERLQRGAPPLHLTTRAVVQPNRKGLLAEVKLPARRAPTSLQTLYATFYAEAPWVEVLPLDLPTLPRPGAGALAQVGLRSEGDQLLVRCALGPGQHGGPSQAVEALDAMLGLPRHLGVPETAAPLDSPFHGGDRVTYPKLGIYRRGTL